MQNKGSLYLLLSIACCVGYFWLFWAIQFPQHTPELCLMQQVGNIPCPSCGTTRSVMALMQGNITEAAMLNPLGFLMASVLILLPLGLIRDWVFGKSFLHRIYHKMEQPSLLP